ncbi:MAG: hypothetical protein HKP58_02920 [Desulfatitalea sp.]|nr:hypothetical protein [Desulfatitalea sp.]NNJ99343.1 hypothetical protein [Desulfatitalea sp.]
MKTRNALTKNRLDESRWKRRYLFKLLAHPVCLVPFLVGLTDVMALWTFDISSGAALFAGIAALLFSAGFFLTRLTTGDPTLVRQVTQRLQAEAVAEREKHLDDLDRRLTEADRDPRPEKCLRDLRALAKAFEQGHAWDGALGGRPTVDILAGVDKLFRQSVLSLEKTLDLGYAAQQLATEAARTPLQQQRERLIDEVAKSIHQLGKVLAGIQSLESGTEHQEGELAAIRQELDQSLEVARRVKKRIASLDEDIDAKV